jgi:mannose/fructose/N-acetylgalactosamine-specific phosphotransferase system component IIB
VAVEARDPGGAVEWYADAGPRRVVLLRTPAALAELVAAGAPVGEANIGGVYPREGARRFLDYVHLTREDIDALRRVAAAGVRLTAQDLPTRPAVDLNLALAEGRLAFDNLPDRSA